MKNAPQVGEVRFWAGRKRAVKALERKGFLEVNAFHQARHTGKVFA